jgi:general secretion pathway protein K
LNFREKKRSVILVLVLVLIGVLISIFYYFSSQLQSEVENFTSWRDNRQAEIWGDDFLRLSLMILHSKLIVPISQEQLEQKINKNLKMLNLLLPCKVNLSLEDEKGKINVNQLILKGGFKNKWLIKVFKNLLLQLKIQNLVLDRILTFLTVRKFQTKEELFNLREVSRGDILKLWPYITVYGDGKINLNTASNVILKAIIEDEDDVKQLLLHREKTSFSQISDLLKFPNWREKIVNLQEHICFFSFFWKFKIDILYQQIVKSTEAIVKFKENLAEVKWYCQY